MVHGALTTVLAPIGVDARPDYEPDALIPSLPFDPVSPVAISVSEAIVAERRLPLVALLDLRAAVAGIEPLVAASAGQAAEVIAHASVTEVMNAVLAALRAQFVWPARTFHLVGLADGARGVSTTTIDRRRGVRLGMHFDSWDELPMVARSASRTRLALNVGGEDRHLLFVPLPAADIYKRAAGLAQFDAGRSATVLFRQAWRSSPDMGVYRLRVPPGFAYLAPTDNLAHDGSTLGMRGHDFSLQALGDFRPIKAFFAGGSTFSILPA